MTKDGSFILKGSICYSLSPAEMYMKDNTYLVCVEGVSQGVFEELPEEYKNLEVIDCGRDMIIPGMTDLHLHAPQYTFRGFGMDMELLDWLNINTFPEESKYIDLEYANRAYDVFTEDLKNSATTRAVMFATLHVPATELLMDKLEDSGLVTYVGKVNMDRNSADYLCENSAADSLADTLRWIKKVSGKYRNTRPILTPRFIPTCSDELMEGLSKIQKQYDLPVQSHLSENFGEIQWVKELCPWSKFYGDAYDHFQLFGGEVPTIMAHCVHSSPEETALMKKQGVYVAHCPQSNMNLSSGVAPVRKYLEEGLHMGLGTDIAGGSNLSMMRCVTDAIQASKLRWRLKDGSLKPLSLGEAFYLATVGGGSFFGKVGSFAPGYEVDALVLSDEKMVTPREQSLEERLERYFYLAEEKGAIKSKFVSGRKVF